MSQAFQIVSVILFILAAIPLPPLNAYALSFIAGGLAFFVGSFLVG